MERLSIAILGKGGNSLEIYQGLLSDGFAVPKVEKDSVWFFDDNKTAEDDLVIGPLSEVKRFPNSMKVFAIGSPQSFHNRARIFYSLDLGVHEMLTLVHHSSHVASNALISQGAILLQNSFVGAQTVVGVNVLMMPKTFVGHDSVIAAHSVVAAGASIGGGVRIGESCYIGMNASLREGIEIGSGCMIGMGSTVTRSIPSDCVVYGNPAKIMRRIPNGFKFR